MYLISGILAGAGKWQWCWFEKISNLSISLKNCITESKNQTYKISLLNEFIFQRCGFHGEIEDYYNPKNNFLNYVVDKKTGIPITLAILYSELGKNIGLDLRIIGFPSHVVIEGGEELILDCLLYTSPSPRDLSTSRMPASA